MKKKVILTTATPTASTATLTGATATLTGATATLMAGTEDTGTPTAPGAEA